MQYVTIPQEISLSDINRAFERPILERQHNRSRGTHLTDILQRMNKESGRLKERIVFGRNTYEPLDEENLPACMFMGMAFETMLMQLNPWLMRIGEVTKDGIAMSPDAGSFNCYRHALSPDKKVPVVLDEVKLSWKSSTRMLEEHYSYLQQTKAYCYGLDTVYARIHVMHINGNYKFGDDPGGGPHYYQHHIIYSAWELQSNWSEITRKKAEYGL